MNLLTSNLLLWRAAPVAGDPNAPRTISAIAACDQCKHPITNGKAAWVLISADVDIPTGHAAVPVLVHSACMDSFHEAHPTRWEVVMTLQEFVNSLVTCTRLDELKATIAAQTKEPPQKAEPIPMRRAQRRKKKSRPPFAA